jgi:hypothetical protein
MIAWPRPSRQIRFNATGESLGHFIKFHPADVCRIDQQAPCFSSVEILEMHKLIRETTSGSRACISNSLKAEPGGNLPLGPWLRAISVRLQDIIPRRLDSRCHEASA